MSDNKKLAIIRVDSSFNIGTGHVMRCLTLAESLRQRDVEVQFICRQHPGNLVDLLQEKDFQVHLLSLPSNNKLQYEDEYLAWLAVSQEQDAEETLAILEKLPKVDWLVVDHYALDKTWEQLLRSRVSKILVIDDLANRQHDCDLLLDQTFMRKKENYKKWVASNCRLLLGSDYTIIPLQFACARSVALQRREIKHPLKNILVSMGGSDPSNSTQFVINSIVESNLDLNVDVVLGPCALHRDSVKQFVENNSLSTIHIYDNVANFSEMMATADLAIGAAGTTAWERCCLGLPTIMIATAENQLTIAKELSHVGAVKYLGTEKQVTEEQLLAAIEELINNPTAYKTMSDIAATICDGYGVRRVLAELLPELANDGAKVRLRPACMEDAALMLQWQQHPSTRKYARNPNPPTQAEHYQWLQKRLNNPSCIFNIVLYGEKPAGIVRIDRVDDLENTFEVSILTSSDYRRLGLAAAGLKLIRLMFPDVALHAEVLFENNSSHALFVNAGYQLKNGMYISKL